MARHSQPFSTDAQVESSLRHSVKDGIYFSVMTGSAESYFSAFAIYMQLSTAMIGVLASLPPLLASFTQMLSAWLGRKIGHRKHIIVFGALLQASMLVPLGAVPLLPQEYAGVALIATVFVYLCGPNLGAPQWNSLIGDLLPESRRGRFFAARTRISSVASVAALAIAGLVLEGFDRGGATYWGFVSIFACAMAARFMSAHHLRAMHEPSSKVAALEMPSDLSLWRRIRQSKLPRFSAYFASMQFAVAISGPYFTLYMLRDLGLSYFQFMILSVASVAVQFLTLNRWGRLSDLFGNRLLLVTTGTIITIIPALWLITTNYYWLLTVQALSGLSWAGFTLSATAFVFDLTPAEHRATLFAAHNILAAVAVFLGAGAGAIIVSFIPDSIQLFDNHFSLLTPLYGLFLISCLARITVAALFLPTLKEVRRVRRMSPSGLIFRVTRMHPISGLIYDIVGRARPRDDAKDTRPDSE